MWGLGSSPSDTRRGLCAATRAWMGLAPITGVLCTSLHIFAHSRYFQMHYDHNQIISDYIRLYHHTVHPYSVAFCAWVLLEPSGLSSTVGGIAGSQLCREIHGGSGGLVWQWPEGAASMWSQHCEVRVTSSIFQSGRLDIELSSTSPTYDMYRYKYYTLYSVAR